MAGSSSRVPRPMRSMKYEAGEGGSILYGTTSYFMERMGLGTLDELPAIAPFLPEVDALDDLAERGRG